MGSTRPYLLIITRKIDRISSLSVTVADEATGEAIAAIAVLLSATGALNAAGGVVSGFRRASPAC